MSACMYRRVTILSTPTLVKQNEYFKSNTAVRGHTTTLPDLYSYFVFLFPLIPQTHIRL